MNSIERVLAASRVIVNHRVTAYGECTCGDLCWTTVHVAEALDKAGLLCALVEHLQHTEVGQSGAGRLVGYGDTSTSSSSHPPKEGPNT